MFSLFSKLTSRVTEVRRLLVEEKVERRGEPTRTSYRNPLWINTIRAEQSLNGNTSERQQEQIIYIRGIAQQRRMVYFTQNYRTHYYTGPWYAYGVNRRLLPFEIYESPGGRVTVIGPTLGKKGIPEVTRESTRINEFNLEKAIIYSYLLDIRFVLVVCAMIGVTAWWALAPEQFLLEPKALCTPNLEYLSQVARDTYEKKVCSLHQVSSPCECGEAVNKEIKRLLGEPTTYDPLDMHKTRRLKGIATLVGSIILSLALAESVSLIGIRSDV